MAVSGATLVLQRRAIFAGAGLVLAALMVVLAVALARGRDDDPGGVTGTAPAFSLPAFEGGTFSLQERADGPVFIYFWASWCIPCEAEAPVIQRLWEEYRGRGYTFVGVNMWDSEPEARRFAERYGLTFPLVRDEGGKVYLAYGVERLPMAFFIRPGLEIEQRYLGVLEEPELREMLDRLKERA